MKLYPLTFEPLFKERIWGGRSLESLYGKALPPGLRIGESWEICDRPGDQSVVANGPLRGKTLHWLMEQSPAALLGPRESIPPRFPLLIKILDAQETLSLQVHPPAGLAAKLGGEPKTEMWYVACAGPKAELFVGLKNGVTRTRFEQELAMGTVADCFHRIHVKAGDAMFLPSGRVHALGAETVIFEIQQNSDTTYRVFDWNRVDRDGKARELHVPQSLASIDFNDFEPELLPQTTVAAAPGRIRPLVENELFEVGVRIVPPGSRWNLTDGRMQAIGVIDGALHVVTAEEEIILQAGRFCLFPAQCSEGLARTDGGATFLQVH
jgi:mannose-6-phosphate isomerase